jgi:aspartokinase-like uncharacterized kinase
MSAETFVKVGGSLFDLPNLGEHLRAWLATLPAGRVLLAAGGGAAADLVRDADRLDGLGEERSHWLALRALTFTAHQLAARLEGADVVTDLAERHAVWNAGRFPILDLHAFAIADENNPDHLPHLWSTTSDSLAARVAIVADISDLVLLKSRDVPPDWAEAVRAGAVDPGFPILLAAAGAKLRASAINFRRFVAARST